MVAEYGAAKPGRGRVEASRRAHALGNIRLRPRRRLLPSSRRVAEAAHRALVTPRCRRGNLHRHASAIPLCEDGTAQNGHQDGPRREARLERATTAGRGRRNVHGHLAGFGAGRLRCHVACVSKSRANSALYRQVQTNQSVGGREWGSPTTDCKNDRQAELVLATTCPDSRSLASPSSSSDKQ